MGEFRIHLSLLSLAALVLAALSTMIQSASYAGEIKSDWAIVKFTADTQSGDILYRIYGTFAGDGEGPIIVGSGDGGKGSRRIHIDVACCGGPASLTTSSHLGGLQIDFFDQERATGGFTTWLEVRNYQLDIGETKAALVFVVNAAITSFSVDRVQGSAVGTLSTAMGNGSKVLYDADPGSGGASIGLGKVAVGVSAYFSGTAVGLAGSFFVWGCEECIFEWRSPDGRSATYAQVSVPSTRYGLTCCPDFAGPAGDWTWTWAGIDVPSTTDILSQDPFSRAVVAAFAPIGEHWALFDPSGGS